ncbi:MAG: VIT1/CCC1 transporter family protein [archaeon]
MNHSVRTGVSFGLTSGVITTLGLIVGLAASTSSRLVIIGGILTIAIADAFSDALGIHVSEESENRHSEKQIWQSTLATFATKFAIALSFAAPVLLLGLREAVAVSVGWGFLLTGEFSYYLSRLERKNACRVVCEHLIITAVVVITTYLAGNLISAAFS